MTSIVSQGSIQRELQEGIHALVGLEYDRWEKQYDKFLTVRDSRKAYEEDVIRKPTGLMNIKPEGQGISYDDSREIGLQRYKHITYGLGIIITQEAIEDNLYESEVSIAGKTIARSKMETKEQVAANLFDSGYDAAAYTTWDGKSVFALDHDLGNGGTYANQLAVASQLNESSLEDALIAISKFRDDAGRRINVKGLQLFVPNDLMFIAQRILGSYLQNDTANNAINAIPSMGMLPNGWENITRLTDDNNWFIRTDVDNGGSFFERSDMDASDNDFGTSNYRHKGVCRFSVGVTDPRGYFGSGEVA